MRQIILYAAAPTPSGDPDVHYVFWLAVPAALQAQFANPNFKSVVPNSATVSWGVTAAELAALQNGSVLEQAYEGQVPAGATQAAIENYLQTHYATAQAALNAMPVVKAYAGASWDGTTWTNLPA